MSTPKYRRLDPGQRREQILDAANALFAERAYDEVSIEDIASAAGVTRGLVHHYFGGRKEVYIALVERIGALREERLPPPVGRSARARVADDVSRWLDWTEANRSIWLATLGRGEDIADPDVSGVVVDLVRRAVALIAARHAEIAEDSPRLRYALECWTGLNRAATRRWLTGAATREATHELIAATLEHVLRTFGAPSAPAAADPLPETSTSRRPPVHHPRHRLPSRSMPARGRRGRRMSARTLAGPSAAAGSRSAFPIAIRSRRSHRAGFRARPTSRTAPRRTSAGRSVAAVPAWTVVVPDQMHPHSAVRIWSGTAPPRLHERRRSAQRSGAILREVREVRPEREIELRHELVQRRDVGVERRVQGRLEVGPERRGGPAGRAPRRAARRRAASCPRADRA